MASVKTIKTAIKRKYPAVSLDDTVKTAMEAMAKNNASALVVKNGDDLLGIVTITDIMHCLADDLDPQATSVSTFMTKCDLITAKETTNPCAQLDEDLDALSAVKVMLNAGVNHLIVSGKKGEPVGIVTSLELIKLISA